MKILLKYKMRKINKVLASDGEERALLIMAAWSLLRARILLACIPIDKILYGAAKNVGCHSTVNADVQIIPKLSWAIHTAAANVPWRSDCFVKSLAVLYWVRRIGMVPSFHLGIRRGDDGEMIAHSWVTVGSRRVTDQDTSEFYSCFDSGRLVAGYAADGSKSEGQY